MADRLADAEADLTQWEENPDPDGVIWQQGFDDAVDNVVESDAFNINAFTLVRTAMDNIAEIHDLEMLSGDRVYELIADTLQKVFKHNC